MSKYRKCHVLNKKKTMYKNKKLICEKNGLNYEKCHTTFKSAISLIYKFTTSMIKKSDL